MHESINNNNNIESIVFIDGMRAIIAKKEELIRLDGWPGTGSWTRGAPNIVAFSVWDGRRRDRVMFSWLKF